MAFFQIEKTTTRPNFLASEIGLIQKTYDVEQAGVAADEKGKRYIKAGTVFPANDGTAIGIVFEEIDVTNDAVRPASIIIAGRILKNRLPEEISDEALKALTAKGLFFDEAPETVREYEVDEENAATDETTGNEAAGDDNAETGNEETV